MAIYESSKRSPLVVRMASFLLFGAPRQEGSSSNKKNNNSISKSRLSNLSTTTATVGLGLAVLLYMTGMYENIYNPKTTTTTQRRRTRRRKSTDCSGSEENLSSIDSMKSPNSSNNNYDETSSAVYYFCRSMIETIVEAMASSISPNTNDDDPLLVQARRRALEKARRKGKEQHQQHRSENNESIVLLEGCCQCTAVQYQIRSPRTLYVYHVPKENSSAIQYPQIKIPAIDFMLKSGSANLQSFQSLTNTGDDGPKKISAYTFCSRCGVHLLHANKYSDFVYINVLTLKKDNNIIQKSVSSLEEEDFERSFTESSKKSDDFEDIPRSETMSNQCHPTTLNPVELVQQDQKASSFRKHAPVSCLESNSRSSHRKDSPVSNAMYGSFVAVEDVEVHSVASTISDNNNMQSASHHIFHSSGSSVYSRTSSSGSHRSTVDQAAHHQLLKYLGKHVSPTNTTNEKNDISPDKTPIEELVSQLEKKPTNIVDM